MVRPPVQPKFSHMLSSVHPSHVLVTSHGRTTRSFHLTDDLLLQFRESPPTAAQKCGSLSRRGDRRCRNAVAWTPSLPCMSSPLRMLWVTLLKNSTRSFPQHCSCALPYARVEILRKQRASLSSGHHLSSLIIALISARLHVNTKTLLTSFNMGW